MYTKLSSIYISALALILITFFGILSPQEAKAESSEINTIQDLEKALTALDDQSDFNNLSEEEKRNAIKKIWDKTSSSAREELLSKIEEALQSNNELGYNSKKIANGIEVFTSATDKSEEYDNELSYSPIAASAKSGTITKAYGKRLYNITAGLNIKGIGAYVKKLGSHYTIASNGLTMRYVETDGTYIVLGTVSQSAKILDKRAEKVGYDINGYGKYHATVTIVGQPLVDISGSITSKIKLKSLDKKNKKAVVVQSFTMK